MIEAALASRLGILPRGGWQAELLRAVSGVVARHALEPSRFEEQIVSSPRLLREVAEQLMVSESYFFRQMVELERASDVLALAIERRGVARVWSAGCARGEEVYSVLALLHERSAQYLGSLEAWGTDINAECIARAERGVYGEWSLRGVSPKRKADCFEAIGPNTWALRSHLTGRVRFTHETILERIARFGRTAFDVILFRNVGIYLTQQARREVWLGMQGLLNEGGTLLMASTDPLPRRSEFPSLRRAVDAGDSLACPAPAAYPDACPSKFGRARAAAAAGPASAPFGVEPQLKEALALADSGELTLSIELLDSLLYEYPRSVAVRFARGRVLFAKGEYESAHQDFSAVADRPEAAPLANYYGALCQVELGRKQLALQQLRPLERQLAQLAPDSCVRGVLPHAECSARELLAAVRSDKRRLGQWT